MKLLDFVYKHKQAALIGFFGILFSVGVALTLPGCGRDTLILMKGDTGVQGSTGPMGPQGYGSGIFTEAVSGLCGTTNGVRVTTFQDKDNDAFQDQDEFTTSVSTVCNGQDGSNGANGSNGTSSTMSIVSNNPSSCGTPGGYTLTVTTGSVVTSKPVCNGAKGQTGDTGPMGPQGIPGLNGLNGTPGTVVAPVKFCNNDPSRFPEYGLLISGRLFAVYWGDTPGSPGTTSQAFWTEVLPGNYMSTGGNNCSFTILANGSVQ